MSDILLTKGQEQDRAQRRLEKYRARHEESIPRFEHTLNGINEQQKQETLLLRQRFLEPRAKKASKKAEKKTAQSSAEVPNTTAGTKAPKRDRSEELDLNQAEQQNNHEPTKLSNGGPSPNYKKRKSDSSMTKFSVDSGHAPKNGSIANSVPNLKLITNKDAAAPLPPAPPPRYGVQVQPPSDLELRLKQESGHVSNFADLDQCAAALEKDGTTSMGLMEGSTDGLIPSDTLKDLISDISDLNPDFIGDFDFDEDRHSQSTNHTPFHHHYHNTNVAFSASPRNVKMEEGPSPAATSTASPLSLPHPSQTPPQATNVFDASSPTGTNHSNSRSSTPNPSFCPQTTSPTAGGVKSIRMSYESPSSSMVHDSPAATTLKQMAQHHQHKQMEIAGSFQVQSVQSNSSPACSPFAADPYSPLGGEFVPTGQQAFRNVRCHSGDGGVIVKQENPGPGMVYGSCPNYPRSPVDLMALAKRSKSPGNTMGHPKSFTQAHLNPQLPPSYRNSFSPPNPFPPSNQPIYMQHKINQPSHVTHQQHNTVHQGPQMGMGMGHQDHKAAGMTMSHHQSFPTTQYYQNAGPEGCFPGAQHDKGQTINFTQQHLRLSQSGHIQQQQPVGRMTGISNPGQFPNANHLPRPQLRNYPPGVAEISDVGTRMPLEVQHRMGIGGGTQGNEMPVRFSNGNSLVSTQQSNQRINTHRHQIINDAGYHHLQQQHQQQHMGLAARRASLLEGRISNNQNQANHTQLAETWHTHSPHPDNSRPFQQHQHFHPPGISQQQNMSFIPNPNQQGGFAGYVQNQRITHSTRGEGKVQEDAGLVLKTENDPSDFNLLLEGMGDDYSFDPTSSYQNILDTF